MRRMRREPNMAVNNNKEINVEPIKDEVEFKKFNQV